MSVLDDLMDRWEQMYERGINIPVEELCAEYPELIDSLRLEIEALVAFESLFGSDTDVTYRSPHLSTAFTPPTQLGTTSRFRVEGCYATGGLGQIYLAFDEVLGRRVAIKFPKRQGMSQQQIARFELEAKITGRLDHPGIVPVYSMDSTETGEPCYVMRFVEGMTQYEAVKFAIDKHGGEPGPEYWQSDSSRKLLQSLIVVCNTVAFAHEQRVLHRDIKPNNILLGPFGETLLLDWGVAKLMQEDVESDGVDSHVTELDDKTSFEFSSSPELTEPGRALGTPAYASPEQLHGTPSAIEVTSDVYSLGVTLFFVLCGKSPLDLMGWGAYLEVLRAPNVDLGQLLPAKLPRELRAICSKAMQVDVRKRYGNPSELASDIDRYLAREPVSVVAEPWWNRASRWVRKYPAFVASAVAGGIVLVLATIVITLVIGVKNQQLGQSNLRLATALRDVRSTNDVTMHALRSMVNESVTHRMAQREVLSSEDRLYIESILQQYSAIAALKGDSIETRALRAEALGQVGCLYYQLNQNQEAEKFLGDSILLCEDVLQSSPHTTVRNLYATFVEVQAAIFTESSDFLGVEQTTTKGIEHLENTVVAPSEQLGNIPDLNARMETEATLAGLYMMRANARMTQDKSIDAAADFGRSISLLEKSLEERPTDVSLKFSAGGNLRAFASMLNDHAASDSADRVQALNYASRAIELLTQAVELRPDLHRYQSSLAWAYYDRSFVYQAMGQLDEAITDMSHSCKITKTIASQYPMFQVYEARLAPTYRRRALLLLQVGKVEASYSDARNMMDLELSPEQLTQCIELIRQVLEQESAQVIVQADAKAHLAELSAKRGRSMLETKQFDEAERDFELAVAYLIELLPNSNTHSALHAKFLLWNLELGELQVLKIDPAKARATLDRCAKFYTKLSEHFTDAEKSQYLKLIEALGKKIPPPERL